MKFNKLFLIAVLALPVTMYAQNDWDVGLKLGACAGLNSIGGIVNSPARSWVLDVQPSQIREDVGGYIRYRWKRNLSITGEFEYLRLQGFDSLSPYVERRDRNLNYRDDIFQGSVRGEWTFYTNPDVGGYFNYNNSFNAYLFLGVGIFHMEPEEMFTHSWVDDAHGENYSYGDWYPTRELTTEGEQYRYYLIQPSVPMGLGFYYTLNNTIRLGWEVSWVKTFTKYIDDVSGLYPQNGGDVEIPNQYTKYLTNQSQYVPGITPAELANYGPGSPRGDDKDGSWISSTLNVGFVIKSRYSQSIRKKFYQKVNYKSRASF